MKHGDFDQLAERYGQYRPGYAPQVLDAILGLVGKRPDEIEFVDVGAGTGIWTRMVRARGCRTTAIEPSGPMRTVGIEQSAGSEIQWIEGSAERTGLPEASVDLLSMASSFHWPDYQEATREFQRILRPCGVFCALWNPRRIETNPLLVEIEKELNVLVPGLKRVSSGKSEFCDGLHDRLAKTPGFEKVVYIEAEHTEHQSPARYLGLWESVNDIRVQVGEETFAFFLDRVRSRIEGIQSIEATYTTRAWIARKPS
ncbi:MAG TPA: class I SAM-dependent methyltransferase [Fibrobacteria bacterium]|nr:class I SAM-dependent methyltransferase [Fibrobacteria bacterium]